MPTVLQLTPDDPLLDVWIDLIAARMRATLIEVLGEARGSAMYSLDWLRARAAHHLNTDACQGAIFLADPDNEGVHGAVRCAGHTIVRIERDEDGGPPCGLFSTTYVAPEARRDGIANALLDAGEAWLIARGAPRLATHTSDTNTPLIRLYQRRGYRIVLRAPEARMIRLERAVQVG